MSEADYPEVNDGQWFKIDTKTGQITATTPSNQDALTAILQQDKDEDTTATPPVPAPRTEFEVTVIATDPSGATATVKVTIEIAKVDEAPTIAPAPDLADGVDITATEDAFNVKTDEEVQLDPSGIGSGADLGATLPIFEATDPEGMLAASELKDERIEWSLSGPDAGRFDIVKLPDTHNNDEAGSDPELRSDTDTSDGAPTGGYFVDEDGVRAAGPAGATAFDLRLDGKVKGALRWTKPFPSFEAMDSADGDNVYVVVVTASDGAKRSSKTVTVTVENVEEPGSISLSQRRPQEGIPITARLTDKDENISGTAWQWYRGTGTLSVDTRGNVVVVELADDSATVKDAELTPSGYVRYTVIDGTTETAVVRAPAPTADSATPYATSVSDLAGVTSVTFVTHCDLTDEDKKGPDGKTDPDIDAATGVNADNVDEASDTCKINAGTSATYVPTADDAKMMLQVRATYVDGFATDIALSTDESSAPAAGEGDDDGDAASVVAEHEAVERPNANTRPRFLTKGPLEREVAENVKGASVGDPVAGIDADPLLYELSGDDSDAFDIDKSGQITTAVKLDYETKSSYTVTVTATDPSLASASIVVNITVTDEDDAGTVILLTGNAPAFAADEMTRSVAENTAAGAAIGDPVAAADEDGDALTYTLWGDDAGSFGIDSATGQLMTSAALDYETKMSYTVTVTASSGKADEMDAMTTVTISVTDEGLDNAYDLNEDGTIERDEVIAAIQDYLAGNIERSEVTALIRLYFGNGG